ncbi:MAG: CcdB family protein [Alphaproteobacteria bacterium]|nr:CcdB family protein [Alphaproteobacteria bacterium]MBF0335800.1 CcdB family protein [Alphaproteobacteria bacterium]MBF0394724.1 CcdB family protein [Alphaproteobacteria bacterium]
MARLDLFRLQGVDGYFLDVQADLMSGLATTVVVPLLPLDVAPQPANRLNPTFTIEGEHYVMVTQALASVQKRELGSPIGTLDRSREYDVTGALDMLLSGS